MFCLACGDDLRERKGDRRLLCSHSTRHVLPTLLDAAKHAMGRDVEIDEEILSRGFICKPCWKQLEKCQKLQEQIGAVQQLLRTNVAKAVPYLPLVDVPEASSSQGLLGRKRQLSPPREEAKESPKRRRQVVRTLSRATVASSSTSSPAVSVS